MKLFFANKFYSVDVSGKIKYLKKEEIQRKWEESLKLEGHNVKLENFTILKSTDDTGKVHYFLKAISSDEIIETGAFFKVTERGMMLLTIECTCTGCADGCHLTISGGYCRCSSCFGNQTCTKTEKSTGLEPADEGFE